MVNGMREFNLSSEATGSPLFSRFVNAPVMLAAEAIDRFEGALASLSGVDRLCDMLTETASEDGFWPEPGSWKAQYRPYVVVDGLLQIPVKGILLADFSFAVGSLATGYTYLRRALERGLSDQNVKGIAWLHDSGGGEVQECMDLCDFIYAQRGKKPMRAFCEFSYSASYALSSAADRVLVTRTGGVGSIGTVSMHVDISGALDAAGIKVTLIDAPKGGHKTDTYPHKRLNAAGEARLRERTEALYSIFVEAVARNRGMQEEDVRATKALTYMADEAQRVGLVDGTGVVVDAVTAFAGELNPVEGTEEMTDKTTKTFTQADVDQAVAAASTEAREVAAKEKETAVASAKAEGIKEGASAERERIKAITSLEEAKGRHAAALSLALTTDMSADAAKVTLAALPKETAPGARSADSPIGLALDPGKPGGSAETLSPEEVAANINKQFGARQ